MVKKEMIDAVLESSLDKRQTKVPVGFVPEPTAEYRAHRKLLKATASVGAPPIPSPIPIPTLAGPRVLMWKQDPSVSEIGIRKAFLPRPVSTGPSDARIKVTIAGMLPVAPNAMGDFIQTPLTAEFDAVHAFAIVRETLTMYQRALASGDTPATVPWQWNTATIADPIQVFPRHSNMQNAFYSRTGRLLAFGFFPGSGATIFTCRSLDIVAHEGLALERKDVGKDIVERAGEDLRQRVNFVADLTELQIVIGIAQSHRQSEREAELLGKIGEERFVVQVRLRLRNDRFHLIEL